MKAVLISIQPKWCEAIAAGEKTIEARKTAPKCEVPFKGYIYATRPKKYYKCGAVSTSDELLWLANGKVEMCDGFKFWADGDEYQCLNGKVIGEFICDKIYTYYADDFVGAEDFDGTIITEPKEGEFAYWIPNQEDTCLRYLDIKAYGKGKPLYGWHISDLKIYDKPKELSEFKTGCKGCKERDTYHCKFYCYGERPIIRPPQSYMFVEEIENE